MTGAVQKLLIVGLAAVVGGLGYLNVWLASTPVDASPIFMRVAAQAVPADDPIPSASFGPLEQYSETLARPLFRAGRRSPAPDPAAASTEAAPAVVETPNTMRLVGILVRPGSDKRALIRVAGEPVSRWAEVGGMVGGWKIGSIDGTRVSIERGGTKADLNLFGQRQPDQENREQ